MLDPMSYGFIPPSPALKQTTGNLLAQLAGLHETAIACQATSDMLMFHLVRKRLRACSLPSTTMQQQVQPDSVKNTSRADQIVAWAVERLPPQVVDRLVQLPRKTPVKVFVAFVGLGCALVGVGCASWGMRSRRRRRKPDKQTIWKKEFVPLKYMDELSVTSQDELDAEPKSKDWWLSIPDTDARFTMNDLSGTSSSKSVQRIRQSSSCPPVPLQSLLRKDDDTAEVGEAFRIFRMSTKGQVDWVDEEADGLERSCIGEMPRRVTFA